ncbi:SpoIIE family protein phosphatase [Congregibacter litoralis]|uniref:Serine phosphatase n=1 Tax=Congregibacter litoralis KT71 TaxID=314285 RepID=A4A8V7_9GAMM|nr:SpoIIE family protein phosphatase [Congregibacter litoralis]EAQ97499.2 serine phosphatase [Congregibacter litoralis KT71]
MGRSFTARLVIPVALVAAVVIATGLFIDYRISRAQIAAGLEANARNSIAAAVLRIQELTRGLESSLRFLGEAMEEVPDEARMDKVLRSLLDSNPEVFAAAIALDPAYSPSPSGLAPYRYRRGSELMSADLASAAALYWEEPWFASIRDTGAPAWVEPYFESTGAMVELATFSVPLHRNTPDGGQTFIGVATIDIRLRDLYEYLEDLRVDDRGFGFMLTSRGTLIGAPDGRVISAPLSEVLHGDAVSDWQSWLQRTKASGGHTTVSCPDGNEICQLRIANVEGVAWSVGIVYSEASLLQPLHSYQVRVLIVGAGMLLLVALVIGIVARRLTAPLLELADASRSIARGELDVALPEADGDDEVSQLVTAFDGMRQDLGQYLRDLEAAAVQRSRMDGELGAAREIQMAMLPQGGQAEFHHEALTLWARVRPAKAVGGDLYAFQQLGQYLLISIGDVSDKGVPAALFMARAISLIQQWEVQPAPVPPHIALQQLNEALTRDNESCMFLTLFIAVLDLQSLELLFASGGHTAPVLLREGQSHVIAQERGPALGLQEGLSFPANSIQLQRDDRLVIYTDGFDEAQDIRDELLGEDRLYEILAQPDNLPLNEAGEAIFAAVDTFVAGAPQFDDMSLMLLEIPGERRAPLQAERSSLGIDDSLPGEAARWLEEQWQAQGLPESKLHDMQLVLEEVVCNIRDHAQTEANASLSLGLERFVDRVELECVDPGHAYNPLADAQRSTLGQNTEDASIGGLGLHLITQLTSRQSYHREEGRNILRLRIDLASPAEHDTPAPTGD